jgi:hypothetical protein
VVKAQVRDLGQVLIDRGWMGEASFERARIRHQRLGGHLTTAVLESGSVAEGRVLQAMGEVHGLPVVGGEDLTQVPADVVGLLSARDAVRFRVVPFAATTSRVDVATDRPDNLKELDELSFILGRRLSLHVTTEARLAAALNRFYGYTIPTRLVGLLERLERGFPHAGEDAGREARDEAHARQEAEGIPPIPVGPEPAAAATAPPGSTEPPRPIGGKGRFRPLSPLVPPDPRRTISLTDEERVALRSGSAVDDGSRHPALLEAIARIELASSASQIAESLLDGLEPWLERLVVLRGSAGELVGWKTREAREDVLRLFRVTADEPSVFADLLEGGPLYAGGLAATVPHERLAACWDGDLTGTYTVLPVRIGTRPICVVLGRAKDPEAATVPPEALRRLREAAEHAFRTLLDDRRK